MSEDVSLPHSEMHSNREGQENITLTVPTDGSD